MLSSTAAVFIRRAAAPVGAVAPAAVAAVHTPHRGTAATGTHSSSSSSSTPPVVVAWRSLATSATPTPSSSSSSSLLSSAVAVAAASRSSSSWSSRSFSSSVSAPASSSVFTSSAASSPAPSLLFSSASSTSVSLLATRRSSTAFGVAPSMRAAFATTATPLPPARTPAGENPGGPFGRAPDHSNFVSYATRDSCAVRAKNVPINPKKALDIVRRIQGLSLNEAEIQMQLSVKANAVYIRRMLANARVAAQHNFNMNGDRLYIESITVGRGTYLRRLRYRSRGRHGLMHKYRSNLRVVVKEMPYRTGERRVGRHGRTHSNIERTLARLNKMHIERTTPAAEVVA